jgi:mono/diheme cytochrome c family protein
MFHNLLRCLLTLLLLSASTSIAPADDQTVPDYTRDVAPLLTKYCAGCHSDADREGDLSLQSYESLRKGTGDGPAVLAGNANSSRMIRVLTGGEPAMPPEGEEQLSDEQVALLRRWIDGGAKGPQGAQTDPLMLIVPQVETKNETRPVTSVDISADGQWRAIARHDQVLLEPLGVRGDVAPRTIGPHPGSVNAVHFVGEGQLLTASGVAGLGGVAALWNIENGELVREFKGHSDILYDAELSPDGGVLATCSYDKLIILWDAETGEPLRELTGHNGAVYDVAFSPDGTFLVSASADDTCKIWRVSDGERMDTLGQPLKEAYTCAFSPDGRFVAAGGADNRIRVWRFVSKDRPRINPPVHARFAHEAAVLRIAFTRDGSRLVSIAEDRTHKVWETQRYTELKLWENQPDIPAAVAIAPDGKSFTVGRLDGSIESFDIPQQAAPATPGDRPQQVAAAAPMPDMGPPQEQTEVEPNSDPASAMSITLPAKITGVVHTAAQEGEPAPPTDVDLYRFSATAGQQWVIETDAERSKSPLDTFVEVLDGEGNRIERVLLQAVQDSYFTFRGKDSTQTGDFRVFNWEEMSLNQYFYANGEVVKLWMYPRGPDSGYNVFPGQGTRWTYFDTTGLAHALGEPAYVVEPHPPGSELIPNGLPVFTLYYENDDASLRDIGKDSRLFFTAPADGEYLVKVKDVRGLQGADSKYTLTVRPRRPDFRVTTSMGKKTVAPGSGQEFTVTAIRLDGYEGPIAVEVGGTLPPGLHATSPVVIEAGQKEAYGIVWADADAPTPTAENAKGSKLSATATINGEDFTRNAGTLGELKLAEKAKLQVAIVPAEGGAQPVSSDDEGPLAFEIRPGQTIMLQVNVERHDHSGEVSFGNEFSGRNLPHGAYVDNIGLNGLLLLEGQTQREFFITCDPVVGPGQSRLFHLATGAADGHTSQPVLLHVVGDDRVAER